MTRMGYGIAGMRVAYIPHKPGELTMGLTKPLP
jgi:hypothetical protein